MGIGSPWTKADLRIGQLANENWYRSDRPLGAWANLTEREAVGAIAARLTREKYEAMARAERRRDGGETTFLLVVIAAALVVLGAAFGVGIVLWRIGEDGRAWIAWSGAVATALTVWFALRRLGE